MTVKRSLLRSQMVTFEVPGLHFGGLGGPRGILWGPWGAIWEQGPIFNDFWWILGPLCDLLGEPWEHFWGTFSVFFCTCSRTLKSHVKEQKMVAKELQNTSKRESKWRRFRDPWISWKLMPLSSGIMVFQVRGGSLGDQQSRKNLNPQSSIPESLNPQSSTRF